jgi:hypothetical protein
MPGRYRTCFWPAPILLPWHRRAWRGWSSNRTTPVTWGWPHAPSTGWHRPTAITNSPFTGSAGPARGRRPTAVWPCSLRTWCGCRCWRWGLLRCWQAKCADADHVTKLIAGPGVYICDGCVGRCVDVLNLDVPVQQPTVPEWASMTDKALLDALPRIAATTANIEAGLRMTRQSAWERFASRDD